jgi:hypothetical protein
MSETTVLIVANRTASTPALLAEVHRRRESCRYGLMVPPEAETDWSLDDAVRLVGRAADQGITAVEPGENAAATIHDLVERGDYGEIILSTVPEHHHLWHRHGLTDRVQQLGVPVTVIPPDMKKWGPVEGFPDEWTPKAISPAAVAGFGNY